MPGNHLFDKTGVLRTLPKFKMMLNPNSYRMAHPIYKMQDIEHIKRYHHEPEGFSDKLALTMVKTVRTAFDLISRYNPQKMNERDWLNRFVFLETVAGVPGMVGGMCRHLKSLRTMERDNGWIHHLLQESENERMHLFIFLTMRNPGVLMRAGIALSQAIFVNVFSAMYLIAPRFAHRFVGYLEEEAVYTYSLCLEKIDAGDLPLWQVMKAPTEAVEYYGLDPQSATVRDVILSVRADEAIHRSVNHHFSDIPQDYLLEATKIETNDRLMPSPQRFLFDAAKGTEHAEHRLIAEKSNKV